MDVYIRFERGRDGVEGPTLGPFPFIQITYDLVRSGPNGDNLGYLAEDGDWYLYSDNKTPYSDYTIFVKDDELLTAVKTAREFFINPGKFNPVDIERMYDAAIANAERK